MLAKLKQLFESVPGAESSEAHSTHGKELAAAALMIDVARADYAHDPREMIALRAALRERFGVTEEQLDALVALADAEASEATSAYRFTRIINDEYSDQEKSELIAAMWAVAYADGNLDKYEEHLIRKIAELIYVPHSEFIRTKLQANPK